MAFRSYNKPFSIILELFQKCHFVICLLYGLCNNMQRRLKLALGVFVTWYTLYLSHTLIVQNKHSSIARSKSRRLVYILVTGIKVVTSKFIHRWHMIWISHIKYNWFVFISFHVQWIDIMYFHYYHNLLVFSKSKILSCSIPMFTFKYLVSVMVH